jgi:uncharacterized protein YjiS (DUF1127 family)
MTMIKENIVVRFIRYVIDWRRTRAVIRELNKLTDRQLRDIGLDRNDVNCLIYRTKDELQRGKKR